MTLLDSLVGVFSGKVISEPNDMAAFLTDWRGKWTGVALAVVQPDSTEDVASIVRWCNENCVSVVPQGGNTGLSGGATPSATGLNLVISFTRMNKVREIDVLNNTISLDAGVTLLAVQEAADDVQKLFPLSLAAEGTCTIGGNLATNAGGVQVLRYGNARDLCLGLEVVTSDGSIWNGMKSLRKDNTGYDLKNIFIGSEGTLGVITGATLKLFEKPKSKVVSFIALADPGAALHLLKLAQELHSNELTAFELMSEECIKLVEKHVDAARSPLASRSEWYVLLELSSSSDEQTLSTQIENLLEIAMEREWIADAAISSSIAQFDAIWSLREDISEAQAAEGKTIKHDISLPISVIPLFIEQVTKQLLDRFANIRMVVFGHLGDGNLHFNLSPASDLEKSQIHAFTGLENEVNKLVHDSVNDLKGSISAEHGLGVLRRDEASRYRSETERKLMETLKKSFDPKNLLNPGKVISYVEEFTSPKNPKKMTVKPNFINGKWVEARAHLENINPSDISDVVGHFSIADPSQVLEAIEAAKKSHHKLVAMTPQQRFDALDFIGSEILQRVDELADLLAREEGKALPDAKAEVNRASQIFKFFAGEALRLQGEIVASTRPNMSVEITREPVGVVAVISPWNFPIAIPAWKIAPALAYGNAVVFKPSELAPASAWALTEIISRSSFPSGSFNLLMGYGRDLGPAMIHDSRVDAVTFTGSEATGRLVASSCVNRKGHIAKFQLEMGGKNPLVVLDDADLDIAVECAVNGAFFSTGQRCTASSRLIVTEKIHDEFVTKLIKRMSQLKVGDARAADTNIGPVIDQNQLDKDLQFIQIGQDEGAYLAYGGGFNSIVSGKNGFYLQPTLFTNASNKMRICQEEIFGPIAAVIRVKDAEEALQIANDTPYGLSAGVCTTSLKQASKFKRQLLAGMVMINAPTAGVDPHVPFGGRKSSNFGTREQGRYASEFYTVVKTTYLNS